jgi:hypothetical protein
MKITYNGPYDAVEIAENGQIVERGETADVPDELAARLIEQSSWDANAKDVLTFVGKDADRAAVMLRAEQDGARRKAVLGPLAKLLDVDEPSALPAPEVAPPAEDTPDQKDGE